ncbi:hypothetical protein H5410_057648 [Solanum commersonii]|uniref:PB1 domain-containing protein n=1 Tax=Solanum commersonii TaxID=4109 RepID=A0A9J5WPK7_SOLCO|nr:hypothetical protein H5410_057648 [Solanum commersonii]
MENEHHLLDVPSDICSQMPCKLKWCQREFNTWTFWRRKQGDELEYQRSICPNISTAPALVDLSTATVKWKIKTVIKKIPCLDTSLEIDKRLCLYRRLCLDTLIPIDDYNEGLLGPPERVYRRCLPEYNPDVRSYSAAEFPLLQTAIHLGIHSYYAAPVFNLNDQRYAGLCEIVSTQPSIRLPDYIQGLKFKSVGLYSMCKSRHILGGVFELMVDDLLDKIDIGLYSILRIHSLPFAQTWVPYSQSGSFKVLHCAGASVYDVSKSMYDEFIHVSGAYFIESSKALVGRAFASQGSCFCKDVTLLSIKEYPLVPSVRKARLTQSFAICLQTKCAYNFVFVVEYFLPPNEMVVRDKKTFLNMLLATMKEQLPGFIVASGNELGQRMLVEVVKVSLSDELDSFEIGQPLPSVQSVQDGGETTEIDSFCQQSNLQNGEDNVAAALLVPSCSSDKRDSLNYERTVEGKLLTNKGKVNLDVAHDDHTEDTSEVMQLDSHFEQPNLEINYAGNAMTNNQKIHSHKNNTIQRIEKDHGITRKILEQHFGMTLQDAAKDLHGKFTNFSASKTRKVNVHVSQGVSFQGAEPYVGDQQCPALSQEKGTKYLGNKKSPAIGKPCDSVMTLKVTYRGDIIKFQLSLSSTRVELEGEVEKRFKISLQSFSIKYQDEDDDWILITTDSDLRDGMHSLRSLGRTTMRLLVTPGADT